ncbi:MAG: HD domain-containing protein [Syntrophobacteraceae bacterium]|jgi:HD superfamily phosphohydrolase
MTATDVSILENFSKDIAGFAQEFAGNTEYRRPFPKDPKIIHDPLWGTIKLEPWEVALLDLPLLQRLRQVHQTSLVSYVFPGCNHNRFEHTLGVVQQAQRLIDAVNSQYPSNKPFKPTTIRSLRLAALFHDCGHSCFSHISEDLYESCADMTAFFKSDVFPKCHPHEALSALILRSEPVKELIEEIEAHYKIDLDNEMASNWIIGKPAQSSGKKKHFETQVINGPFDADKLDYIFRDAHYSGLPVGLDLDRLWSSCKVGKTTDGDKVLTLHQASVTPLEQILFSKINLFAIVYQHPKVRAAEKMFQAIIEEAKEKPDSIHFTISGRKLDLNRATDYLWLTDEVFFAKALMRPQNDSLHRSLHDIRYRRFLVRALTISHDTVAPGCNDGFMQVRKLNQRGASTYQAKRELASAILRAAHLEDTIGVRDVWVYLPSDPSFGEADRTFVRTANKSLRKVSDLFPIHYWGEQFKNYKWRGHVFCPQKYQQQIHEAALQVFKEQYELKFKRSAGETSHVLNPKSTARS